MYAADNRSGNPDNSIPFSEEDQAWLMAHPVIRLGFYRPGWPPFDIISEQDQYRGISADYVYLLEKRLGFRAQVIIFSDWEEVLKKLET